MKNAKIFFLSMTVLLATGCAFTPQQAELNPTLDIASSDIGNNAKIFLTVQDERIDTSLGRRGTAYGAAAEISTNQDLSVVVRTQIEDGLRTQGFHVTDENQADNFLTVEIRALEYSTSTGFWTGGVHIKGALKGHATSSESEMEKMYRYEKEERVAFVPGAETNERWINEALSETLKQLLTDSELLNFLAN